MKKKLLCFLLALAVVMSVVPLTALAETVPEEYWGSYKGSASIEREDHDAYFTITENQVTLSIPDYYYDQSLPLNGKIYDYWEFSTLTSTTNTSFKINFVDVPNANLYTTAFNQQSIRITHIEKVSDSTGSTLSTGSDLIIPIGAAVLLIGVVIFMGKRKKAKTE